MITFEYPNMLMLLSILPFVAMIHFISLYAFSKRAQKFANFETLQRLNRKKRVFSRKIPQLLLRLLFTGLIIFAAAGPSIWIEREGNAEDIIFAMDVSGTMLAEDANPNRLELSKNAVKSFINETDGELNAGLISFTSTAYPEVYPTGNSAEIIKELNDLSARSSSGTSIGQAINYGVALLGEKGEIERKIIILTDGQENILDNDELSNVVERAYENGVNTYIIGVGTREGGKIPGLEGEFVVNEEILELISENNPGEHVISSSQEEIVTALGEFIYTDTVKREIKLSFWIFLLGFFIGILEWYLSNYIFRSLH